VNRAIWWSPSNALRPYNVLRRWIHPSLEPLELDWINFAFLRRSHSTLHEERGTDPKIIADQQGHGLGVHLAKYVDTSVARKREAVSWAVGGFQGAADRGSGGQSRQMRKELIRWRSQVLEKMERETGLESGDSYAPVCTAIATY
jgi:hypothetical protein